METKAFRQHALLPKCPRGARRTPYIPTLPPGQLAAWFGKITPKERHAIRELLDGAHVEIVEGRAILVASVSQKTLDVLAAFEADLEDRENDLCDEPDLEDDRDSDNAVEAVDVGDGLNDLGEQILRPLWDDYEPDHDNEHPGRYRVREKSPERVEAFNGDRVYAVGRRA